MDIASSQELNRRYIFKRSSIEEKGKAQENKNRYEFKCLQGYCISLSTWPEPGVHIFPISYNKS